MARPMSLIIVLALSAWPVWASDDGKEAQPAPTLAAAAEQAAVEAAPAPSQTQPQAPTAPPATERTAWRYYRVDFGGLVSDPDTNSSKFLEYRDLYDGPQLPFLRFAGEEKFRYDFTAEYAFQRDGRYHLLAEPGPLSIKADFVQIPHWFGNDAKSVLTPEGSAFTIGNSTQAALQAAIAAQFARSPSGVNFNFLNALVTPVVASTPTSRIALDRDRGNLDVNVTKDQPVEVHLTYFMEKRDGNRGSGTSFGFGNVVETAEPIDYRTQDVGMNGEWAQRWGVVRGGFHYNWFSNANLFQTFDNPFRATDSTDASAYTAPGSGSIGGPSFGRIALPPDNKAVTGSLGVALKFKGKTRLSADATYGEWTQNESFIPFTSNSAIRVPFVASDPSTLPARSLDGKIDVFSLSSMFSTRPAPGLNITARYRRYDLSNKTPRIEFAQGYVRFDAVFEAIPRITVPYGYTNDQLQASVSYDVGAGLTLEGGYKLDQMDRTFRETGKTTQNTFYGSAYYRAADWVVLRASYEGGNRDFEELEIEESEDASFLNPGAPANLLAVPNLPCNVTGTVCNLRFDQAPKDLSRTIAMLQLTPGGNATVALSYVRGKDDYKDNQFGLINAKNEAFTAEADYTPAERVNVFAFYTRENIENFQRGRQSGATVSLNPLDDWTSSVKDKGDTFGGGTTIGIVKDKVDLTFTGSYQKVNGNNDIAADPRGVPGGTAARKPLGGSVDIPSYDDTRLVTLTTEIGYKLKNGLRVALGGWLEDYEIDDAFSNGLTNYVPASFFLAGNDGNYRAHVVYARLSYLW